MVLVVKNLPGNTGDVRDVSDPWVRKIPLEEGMTTHSSIAWRIRGQRSLAGYCP